MAPMLNFRSATKTFISRMVPMGHVVSEKRLKCEKFTDNKDDRDGYKVMTIHMTFQVR